MAKNRTGQVAGIGFVPAIKAALLCLLITGAAVGYVWQKGVIDQLGKQEQVLETRLTKLTHANQMMTDRIAELTSPVAIDAWVKSKDRGIVPPRPDQVVRLKEDEKPVLQNLVQR